MQENTLWVFTVAIAFMSAAVWAQEQSTGHDWANHPENQWIRQEGQPSSPVWFGQSYRGFYSGEWH